MKSRQFEGVKILERFVSSLKEIFGVPAQRNTSSYFPWHLMLLDVSHLMILNLSHLMIIDLSLFVCHNKSLFCLHQFLNWLFTLSTTRWTDTSSLASSVIMPLLLLVPVICYHASICCFSFQSSVIMSLLLLIPVICYYASVAPHSSHLLSCCSSF